MKLSELRTIGVKREKEFSKTGKIVYTYNGSYASQVDVTGGFSKEHKDYINRCIDKSVREWLAKSKK